MKNFSIFKVDKKSDKQPDYKMSAKIGEDFTEIGACWIKEGKSGKKYMSCKLSDTYVDHTKGIAREGFSLITDEKKSIETISPKEIPF